MVSCGRRVKQKLRRRIRLLVGVLILLVIYLQVVLPVKTVLRKSKSWNYYVMRGWSDTDFRPDLLTNLNNKTEIIILRWTAFFRWYYDARVLTGGMCPYLQPSGSGPVFDVPCRISFDRRYLEGSDALIFHSPDLTREKVPQERSQDQVWIYLQEECPGLTFLHLQDYPNVFNWTMTYRRDSDVYHPYGHTVPVVDRDTKINPSPDLAKRPSLAAWVVSRCHSNSKREDFVKQLQNYIPVGIYGKCGKACPADEEDCRAYLAKTYKFYLAFENSLCSDYITEKFFDALRDEMVPVVYGGLDPTDYSAIALEGSYIDARKFGTVRELADYLLYLDRNDEEYLKYFEWKAKFQVIERQGWCNLCQKVFEHLQGLPESPASVPQGRGRRIHKWYKDLWTWWFYLSYDEPGLEHEPSAAGHSRSSHHYKRSACNMPFE